MGLIRPHRLLIPPGGLARPSRDALGKGLSFAQAMTNGPARSYVSAGAVPGAFVSGAALGMTRGGMAMVGSGGYWRAPSGAGTTYTLPTTRGTVFFHGFSVTASGDATWNRRYMWTVGNAGAWPASPWCGATDFDGLIYAGWVNGGVDGRVTASSASGAAWPAQSLVTVALSYGPGGQRLYLNGRFAGSNLFNNFGSTAAGVFSAGDGDGLTIPWARTTGDAVHYFTIYEREFTDGEHHDAHQNPWWWIEGQRQPFGRNIPPPPPEPSTSTTTTFQSHGVLRRRVRRQIWRDVPEELKPVVALAEEWTEADPVRRAVDEALARHARMTTRTTMARRERLIDEAKRAIISAVERAAEMDDEEALIALL